MEQVFGIQRPKGFQGCVDGFEALGEISVERVSRGVGEHFIVQPTYSTKIQEVSSDIGMLGTERNQIMEEGDHLSNGKVNGLCPKNGSYLFDELKNN